MMIDPIMYSYGNNYIRSDYPRNMIKLSSVCNSIDTQNKINQTCTFEIQSTPSLSARWEI